MFLATRPTRRIIERFQAESEALPLSYGPVGLVRGEAPGYRVDELIVPIGRGEEDFDRAKAALAAWKHFDIGWVEPFPAAASPEPGGVVALAIHHFGFWSLNGCRVLYRVGDRDSGTRFGFAYGTLMNHAEAGEELFEVFMEPTGEVAYRIRAASRPRAALTWLGYPLVRALQARCRRDSGVAMRRATAMHGVHQ